MKVNTLLKDGKEANFVLASTLKQVGTTVQDISNKAEKGEIPWWSSYRLLIEG